MTHPFYIAVLSSVLASGCGGGAVNGDGGPGDDGSGGAVDEAVTAACDGPCTMPPGDAASGADSAARDLLPPPPDLSGIDAAAGCLTVANGTLDIDVPNVTITGYMSLNGSPPPPNTDGTLFLRDPATGDEALLLDLIYTPKFNARVVPGVYDVYFAYARYVGFTSQYVPSNTFYRVQQGVTIAASGMMAFDVPGVTITGNLTVNGMPVVAGGGGWLVLHDPATGDEALLAQFANGPTYTTMIGPGTYDVYYRAGDPTMSPFANTNYKVQSGVALNASQSLDLDVTGPTVHGNLTINGSSNTLAGGQVTAVNPATGDTAVLGQTGWPVYSVGLLPGTYDIYYENTETDPTGDSLRNRHARVKSGIVVAGGQQLDIDIPQIALNPAFTINGGQGPQTGGRIYIRDSGTGDEAFVWWPGQQPYPAHVVPGTYDVYYVIPSGSGASASLRNTDLLVQSGVALNASSGFTVDVSGAALGGTLTVNGGAGMGGQVLLHEAKDDDALLAFTSAAMPYSALVHPGQYVAYYDGTSYPPTSTIVANSHLILQQSVMVNGAATLDFDIRATALSGKLTASGMPDIGFGGDLVLVRGDDEAYLGNTSNFGYQALVAPGAYDIYYRNHDNNADNQVRNTDVKIGCVVVP
jgi:hypothetical protein